MKLTIGNKSILAISRATYRGYPIYEMQPGTYTVQLGVNYVSSNSLTALTQEIDRWLALKAN